MATNINLLHSPPDNTRPTIASDLEGTLSAGFAWQAMRDYLIENGQEPKFRKFLTRRVPKLFLFRLGLVDKSKFKNEWILGVIALFAGSTRAEMDAMAQFVVEKEIWPQRRQDVIDELSAHAENGKRVILVTGVFEPILAAFIDKTGHAFEGIGTALAYEDDIFTGKIQGEVNTGINKTEQLQPFMIDGKIESAYGDTKADIPMLESSHTPIAVDPDAELRQVATERQWRIMKYSTE